MHAHILQYKIKLKKYKNKKKKTLGDLSNTGLSKSLFLSKAEQMKK